MPKHVVLITGAAGNLGSTLAAALKDRYTIAGLDMKARRGAFPVFEADITDQISVGDAMHQIRSDYGTHIASVLHLAAFFDFSGEDKLQYRSVNVDGSRNLVRALRGMEV